jgi:alcohol dehydrogenase class IV
MGTAGQVTDVISGAGEVARLAAVVATFGPRRLLVVGGRTALGQSEVARYLEGYEVLYFTDFTPNPQLVDVLRGCALVDSFRPDLIIGVGGGSAMDVAKLVRLLPTDLDRAVTALTGAADVLRERPVPLVLVPTTAGTGSEVTRFAAVYVGVDKYSLDHASVHADVALVDPRLTESCPAELTYSCALDALAHAIESTWSRRSTPHSRILAGDALRALVPVLRRGGWPRSPRTRVVLSEAALRAGLAIDITRTTAGHAFAYPLTARFGVRHGVACALNLRWLLPYTAQHLAGACTDPRGPVFVERRLGEVISGLGAGTADEAGEVIAAFLATAGFADRLSAYGVREDDLPGLIRSAVGSQRAGNAPVGLAEADVLPWLLKVL